MDIFTQHCVENEAKVSSFLFRCVGHIWYILGQQFVNFAINDNPTNDQDWV